MFGRGVRRGCLEGVFGGGVWRGVMRGCLEGVFGGGVWRGC